MEQESSRSGLKWRRAWSAVAAAGVARQWEINGPIGLIGVMCRAGPMDPAGRGCGRGGRRGRRFARKRLACQARREHNAAHWTAGPGPG